MTEKPPPPLPPHFETAQQRQTWWEQLPSEWQKALTSGYFARAADSQVADADLVRLARSPVLRLVGSGGMYPNHDQELGTTRPIRTLTNLHYLFLTHSGLENLEGIHQLTRLRSLFIHNNRIESLDPVSSLKDLEELYCQDNHIASLFPIRECPNLHTVYCQYNALSNLRGLTRVHARNLQKFVCLPNRGIQPKEVRRVENKLGIFCLKE